MFATLFSKLSLAGLSGTIEDYVDYDKTLVRPSEVDLLIGDPRKAHTKLGWKPSMKFEALVQLMVDNDLALEGH